MTFAITARCSKTGMLGIAVCTAIPCVGALVSYIRPNIGAIVAMASVDPYLGVKGLDLLSKGINPTEVKKILRLENDIEKRQFAIVDRFGNSAAYTGENCIATASQIVKPNFVVTANMMVDKTTVEKMTLSFETTEELEFPERLLLALEAGNATPGDYRGRQSASLEIFYKDDFPFRSIRVDEHEKPVEELRRIYDISKKQLFPNIALMSKFGDIRDLELQRSGERPTILLKPVKDR